jgi:uncharacterized membrane protein (DUF2068 family)
VSEDERSGRFILLIAVERVVRGVLLFVGGIYLLTHTGKDVSRLAYDAVRAFDLNPDRPFFKHTLDRLGRLRGHQVAVLGWAAIAYGALEEVEGVGLFRRRRWAEWLTVIATSVLIPLELYEVVHKPSWLKIGGVTVNIVIVVYLARAVARKGRPARN